jgi:hypothetical protein
LETVLGPERFKFGKNFDSPDSYEASPSNVALAYLANQFGLKTSYLEKLITKARREQRVQATQAS